MPEAKEQYTAEEFWKSAYEGAAEETLGGVIGKMRVDIGYKVYIAGLTGDAQFDTFFPVATPTEEQRAETRNTARAFAEKHGATGRQRRPDYVAALRLYRDECVNATDGKPVAWEIDQLKTVPLWTLRGSDASAGRTFMEAVQESGAPAKRDFYGRAVWVPDPYKLSLGEAGKTDEDQEGNARVPLFPIVVEVYADKAAAAAAALAAAASNGAGPAEYIWSDFPGEWGEDDWGKLADDYEMHRDTIGEGQEYTTLAEYVSGEFDEEMTWFVRMLSAAGRSTADIVGLTGLKKKDVRKALK